MRWISASCRRSDSVPHANSEKAREQVLSLGAAPASSQPQSLRYVASTFSPTFNAIVVGMFVAALAMKARANA